MKLAEITPHENRYAVIYGGRFQPFHKGHLKAYKWLCKKFGERNVWLAASNKTNFNPKKGDVSPFTFQEKRQLIEILFGDQVDVSRFIECKNPAFKPSEIFDKYRGYLPVYVAACGEKDIERYQDSHFFKRLPSEPELADLYPVKEDLGYYVEIPIDYDLSGTKVRETLLDAAGDRETLFKRFFGKYDETAERLIMAKLKSIKRSKPDQETEDDLTALGADDSGMLSALDDLDAKPSEVDSALTDLDLPDELKDDESRDEPKKPKAKAKAKAKGDDLSKAIADL